MNNYAGYKKLIGTVLQVDQNDILPLRYRDIAMIDAVIDELGSRKSKILRLRFELQVSFSSRDERRTLEAIAEKFGVCRESIRQAEIRALARLRHPSRIWNFQQLTEAGLERQKRVTETPLRERKIEDYELSTRTLNCLKHCYIDTIGELVDKTEVEMLKTKNFGRKSLFELRCLLHSLGLDFAQP